MFIHDNAARKLDIPVTDSPLDAVSRALKGVRAGGGTLHSTAFDLSLRNGRNPDKIVFLTDGGENRNTFTPALERYEQETGKSPALVMIHFPEGDPDRLSDNLNRAGYELTKVEYTGDYYALDNAAAALGGPPAASIADMIMQTELPVIKGLAY
jgi:hypothetical protein